MYWLSVLKSMVDALFRTNGHRSMPEADNVQERYNVDRPSLRRMDVKLSFHFSLFELTNTSNEELQAQNRTLSDAQITKLTALANHCELIRGICGGGVNIHSGYRSLALNSTTVGSASTSQHPKCEAVDFDVTYQTVEDTFNKLLAAAREGHLRFGQLILERAERSYGTVEWVHCSVIGTLAPEKVGQVMKMVAGPDGKPNYILIDRIKFPE